MEVCEFCSAKKESYTLNVIEKKSGFFSSQPKPREIKGCKACVGYLWEKIEYFGLEEIPYPEGAIMFHAKPIAVSFLLFFISSIPPLYKIADNQKYVSDNNVNPVFNQEKQEINEKWEEATLDDLESGNYEQV